MSSTERVGSLTPGTTYSIVLSACTAAGCTNSSQVKAETRETLPDVEEVTIDVRNRTSSSLEIEWSAPARPNGALLKFVLYAGNTVVYEGLARTYARHNMAANSYASYRVDVCNRVGCAPTRSFVLGSDESPPQGALMLEARALTSNQIELKWSPTAAFRPNGNIMYQVQVTGPFLFLNEDDDDDDDDGRIVAPRVATLNLLNATVANTKYGIMDRLIAYSTYALLVNATNSRGHVLSNRVEVQMPRGAPRLARPPRLTHALATQLKIEWHEPLLVNSDDRLFFYQVKYRSRRLWSRDDGWLDDDDDDDHKDDDDEKKVYNNEMSLFTVRTLATAFTLVDLEPSTAYSFRLTASNSFGECESKWSGEYRTLESQPSQQQPPTVLNFTCCSAYVSWTPPRISNGKICKYSVRKEKKMCVIEN